MCSTAPVGMASPISSSCFSPAGTSDAPLMPADTQYRVFVGWDHAVPNHVQDAVLGHLAAIPCVKDVKAFGPKDTSIRVDYPDIAGQVCAGIHRGVQKDDGLLPVGILMCGTGIGVSIAANKCPGVRAGLCHDYYTAQMTRRHNDANVLCFGARVLGIEVALQMISVFLATGFEGGRHAMRVGKVMSLEVAAAAAAKNAGSEDDKK